MGIDTAERMVAMLEEISAGMTAVDLVELLVAAKDGMMALYLVESTVANWDALMVDMKAALLVDWKGCQMAD